MILTTKEEEGDGDYDDHNDNDNGGDDQNENDVEEKRCLSDKHCTLITLLSKNKQQFEDRDVSTTTKKSQESYDKKKR